MKRVLVIAVALGLTVCSAGLSQADVTEPERGYISVSTSANSEVMPDVVEVSIAIRTNDSKSMVKATTSNKEISDKVYSALKGMINATSGDYIKTADFNARPVYTYSSNNKKNFDKYEVSNNIIVHTKNIDKVGAMIDKAISLGASSVNDLVFSVSDYELKCNELLADAAKKAKNRVDIVAKSAGSYVTGIKSMNVSCSTNSNNRVQYKLYARNMAMDSAAGAERVEEAYTPIQSGVVKIYANLNANYYVK